MNTHFTKPCNIFNCDECRMTCDQGRFKVLARQGTIVPSKLCVSNEKQCLPYFSLLFCLMNLFISSTIKYSILYYIILESQKTRNENDMGKKKY